MKPGCRICAIILTLGCALSLSGCALFETAQPQDTPAPTLMPVIDVTPSPTPTPLAINPVSEFYEDYVEAAAGYLGGFTTYLTAHDSIANIEALLLYDEHMAYLTKAQVCIARLTPDGTYFSDALIGAATGTGSMTSYSGIYVFTFNYDDGSVMSGTFDGDALYFSTVSAEGITLYTVLLSRSGSVWASRVDAGGSRSALLVTNKVRFAAGNTPNELDAPTPTLTPQEASATSFSEPTPIPNTTWADISAGLALVALYQPNAISTPAVSMEE